MYLPSKFLFIKYSRNILYCRLCDEISRNKNIEELLQRLPEEPSTCCMSGCANCVWLEYANKLTEIYKDEGETAKLIVLDKIKSVRMDLCIPNVKFTCIEEVEGSNVCFMLCSVITKVLKDKSGRICLILFHNSFNHYQNVILKLGYNLEFFRNKGIIRVIEISDYTVNYITKISNEQIDVKILFCDIIKKLENLNYRENCTYLIMEDVSYLLLTKPLEECLRFTKSFHVIVNCTSTLKLIISCHSSVCDKQQTTFLTAMKYMADVIIKVTSLTTGFSSEMSGYLEIQNRTHIINKLMCYNYKLGDDKVILFSLVT